MSFCAISTAHQILGKTNGAASLHTPKKTDWADSDEDDDFIAKFSALKNPRIFSLEQQLEQKENSIEALNSVLDTKNVRIVELEDIVEHKDHLVSSLEKEMEAKDSQIEQLKVKNNKQFLYVQELVAEVDEKSRRIRDLESELNENCTRIRELEVDCESQTQVSVAETGKTDPKTETVATEMSSSTPTDKGQADKAPFPTAPAVCPSIPLPADQITEGQSLKQEKTDLSVEPESLDKSTKYASFDDLKEQRRYIALATSLRRAKKAHL